MGTRAIPPRIQKSNLSRRPSLLPAFSRQVTRIPTFGASIDSPGRIQLPPRVETRAYLRPGSGFGVVVGQGRGGRAGSERRLLTFARIPSESRTGGLGDA